MPAEYPIYGYSRYQPYDINREKPGNTSKFYCDLISAGLPFSFQQIPAWKDFI